MTSLQKIIIPTEMVYLESNVKNTFYDLNGRLFQTPKKGLIFNKENNGINLVILSLIRNFEALPRTYAQKSSKYFGFLFAYSYLCRSKET